MGYPDTFFCETNAPSSEIGHQVPVPPDFDRGEAWASRVTGPSSSRVPWSYTPPGAVPTRPACRRDRRRLRGIQPSGRPECHGFRGRMAHGPHACAPTHRRSRRRDRRKARYRLGRAHPWPDGFRTRWTTDRISRCHRMHRSFLTSVAWSHWMTYPPYLERRDRTRCPDWAVCGPRAWVAGRTLAG